MRIPAAVIVATLGLAERAASLLEPQRLSILTAYTTRSVLLQRNDNRLQQQHDEDQHDLISLIDMLRGGQQDDDNEQQQEQQVDEPFVNVDDSIGDIDNHVEHTVDDADQSEEAIQDQQENGFVLDETQDDQELSQHANGLPTSLLQQSSKSQLRGQLSLLVAPLAASMVQPRLFPTLYSLALLGSSVGFYAFVYFTSAGFALSIGIPAAWLAYLDVSRRVGSSISTIPWHAVVVVIWSVRLLGFLLYREHFAWPALHQQYQAARRRRPREETVSLQQQDAEQDRDKLKMPVDQPGVAGGAAAVTSVVGPPSTLVQVLCWMVYSFFYTCLMSPCYYLRLKQQHQKQYGVGSTATTTTNHFALALQVTGLVLETVADWTKSQYKQRRPADWCHVGIWRYGRHVNYAGEWLFWLGLWVAGMTRGHLTMASALIMTLGLCFITLVLQGAAEFLSARQLEKYGHDLDYLEFRDTFGALGPTLPTIQHFFETRLRELTSKLPRRRAAASVNATAAVDAMTAETDVSPDGASTERPTTNNSLLL